MPRKNGNRSKGSTISVPKHPSQSLHSRESEIGLIGCMVMKNMIIPNVLCELTNESFFMESTKMIFEHIVKIWNRDSLVDLVMIKDSLGTDIETIGGVEFLASTVGTVPNVASWEAYMKVISRKHGQRIQAEAASKILDQLEENVEESEIYSLADSIKRVTPDQGEKGLGEVIDEGIGMLQSNRDAGQEMALGWEEIDKAIGGLRRKTTYTIGGKTSQGKTTVMSNIVVKALNDGKRVLISVLENPDQVPMRLAAIDSSHPLGWFLKPDQVSESNFDLAKESLNDLRKWEERLLVVGATPLPALKGLAEKFKPDIVVLDYLQKYATRYCGQGKMSKAAEVGKAASDFNDIAIDCDAVGILLSQVSRKNYGQESRRPAIEDLKESGDIENFSDVVMLLYWPARDSGSEKKDPLLYEIEVAKNKMGPAQVIASLKINSDTLKITDWTDREPMIDEEPDNGRVPSNDFSGSSEGGHGQDTFPLPGDPERDVFSGDIRAAV